MHKIPAKIIYALIWLISLLPLRVLYLFTDIMFLLVYCIKPIRYRHKVTYKNLVASFPGLSTKEIHRLERRFYRHFFDLFAETIKNFSASERWISRHMQFQNMDEIRRVFSEGRSAMMYLGHLGNWEWISSLPIHVDPKNICCQVYHPLENQSFDEVFLRERSHHGAVSIPMNNVLRQLFSYKQDGKGFIVGMIADQVPHWRNIHYWTDFLNHDTPVFSGAERIARKMDLAVFYGDVVCTRRGYYTCTVKLMADHAAQTPEFQLTEQYCRMLEETIKKDPSQWLWTHNRWKRTRQGYEAWFQSH